MKRLDSGEADGADAIDGILRSFEVVPFNPNDPDDVKRARGLTQVLQHVWKTDPRWRNKARRAVKDILEEMKREVLMCSSIPERMNSAWGFGDATKPTGRNSP